MGTSLTHSSLARCRRQSQNPRCIRALRDSSVPRISPRTRQDKTSLRALEQTRRRRKEKEKKKKKKKFGWQFWMACAMDSLDKMKLGVLLNNITGGMAVPQSQPVGMNKLAGLGQLGLGNNAQPFFLNQHQGAAHPFSSLKRPREDPASSWLMHQVHPNSNNSSANTQQEEVGGGGQEKSTSRRRTVHQLEVLESVFKLCPNPTEARRKQLGQMLKVDERQVVIWFQNKRQRVRAKMKEQENNTLRQQHSALKSELQREKARERALEQENSLLKTWMEDKVKKMEELRQASSELLVEYYKKKGNNSSNWKNALPSGLMEALKLPQKEGETSQGKEAAAEAEAPQVSGGGGEKTSPDTPLEAEEAGKGQEVVPKEEGAAAV